MINHLQRTVHRVGSQRQVYNTMILGGRALHNSEVFFLDCPVSELLLQLLVGIHRLGSQENARRQHIESVDKHTYVYTKGGCYESRDRLYELEEKLGTYYVRISKSMIVNLRKVRNVSAEPGGRMVAVLLNEERVIISRSYVKEIKRRLGIQ